MTANERQTADAEQPEAPNLRCAAWVPNGPRTCYGYELSPDHHDRKSLFYHPFKPCVDCSWSLDDGVHFDEGTADSHPFRPITEELAEERKHWDTPAPADAERLIVCAGCELMREGHDLENGQPGGAHAWIPKYAYDPPPSVLDAAAAVFAAGTGTVGDLWITDGEYDNQDMVVEIRVVNEFNDLLVAAGYGEEAEAQANAAKIALAVTAAPAMMELAKAGQRLQDALDAIDEPIEPGTMFDAVKTRAIHDEWVAAREAHSAALAALVATLKEGM